MVLIKDFSVLNLHPMLEQIAEDIEKEFGPGVYTSIHRPGDSGVHGTIPVRGLDRRCRDHTRGATIQAWVNTWFEYDAKRPELKCCIFHKVPMGAFHLHFQAHDNTQKRVLKGNGRWPV